MSTATAPAVDERIAALAGASVPALVRSARTDRSIMVAAAATAWLAERGKPRTVLAELAHDPRARIRRAVVAGWEEMPTTKLVEAVGDPDGGTSQCATARLADRLAGLPDSLATRRLLRRLAEEGPCRAEARARRWELDVDRLDALADEEILERLRGSRWSDPRREPPWAQVAQRMTERVVGPTELVGASGVVGLESVDRGLTDDGALMLRRLDGREVRGRYSYRYQAAYLGGISPARGAWAVRVPRHCMSLRTALAAAEAQQLRPGD